MSAVAAAVSDAAPARGASLPLRLASEEELVELVQQGQEAAFEVIYQRYHREVLSFCRFLLRDPDEAQDVVQHTFMAAYDHLTGGASEIRLRAWLFTVARNRCYSLLRSRREQPTDAPELANAVVDEAAVHFQRREDLRELVRDLQRLPGDQRAALVLAELESLSHAEIAALLGVRAAKVKALVFQARESLVATRQAREADCATIREQLATLRGAHLRRGHLRRHLRDCGGCRAFRRQIELERR